MKHSYLIAFALFCCLFGGCKESNHEIVIDGYLEGVEDGVVINLSKSEGRMFINIQSDTVKDGRFRFSFPDSLNEFSQLSLTGGLRDDFPPTWLDLWVAPGTTTKITGKDKLIRSWKVESRVPEQIEQNRYAARVAQYERVTQQVMREAYSYFEEMRASGNRQELRAKIDSLYAINDSLNVLKLESDIDLMAENRTYSPLWMSKLNHNVMAGTYAECKPEYWEKLKNLYEGMNDDLKNSEEGQAIHINLYPPAVVGEGDDMADADMWNPDGELCRLSDYPGKYRLLDFWSSGCGPCIQSIPEMREISELYSDRLVVVGICSDPKEVWERVSKEKEISWVNLNDFKGENGIKLHYGVQGIPHYVLISPEGKVVTSWSGYGKGSLKYEMNKWF